jgi:type II secretory pathway component PulC
MTYAPRIVSAVLIAFMALEIFQAAHAWRGDASAAARLAAAVSARAAHIGAAPADAARAHTAPADTTSTIIAAHLFGIADEAVAGGGDAPESRAGWILAATLATQDSKHGYAIIGVTGQPAALYRTGAAVTGDATLADVFTDRVVLMRAGSAETLWMDRKFSHRTRAPAALAAQSDERKRFGDSIKLEHGPFDPEAPAAPYPTRVITKLHVMPMIMDNHLFGYTVSPQIGSAVKGLPDGAVVTQVNGVLLDGGATAQRMFDSLSGASSAIFTIRDGDSKKDISVDVSGLSAALAPRRRSGS